MKSATIAIQIYIQFQLFHLISMKALPSVSQFSSDNSSVQTLRQVNVIIRHGQRSPQTTYPNDPYKNDPMEPYGWGQLTKEGRLSQYQQGLFLRSRYGTFLGNKYSPEIFWLQSTDVDRAKSSALLEAAALWMPDGNQSFSRELAWQPISLNYQTSQNDSLLLIRSSCPDYSRMRDSILKSDNISKINDINFNLYQKLTKNSGQEITNPDDVFDLYSTLIAEQTMNLLLPNWTADLFTEMEHLSSLSLKINVYNETLLKMKAGPLITEITNNMLKKIKSTLEPERRKMFMYIGHDSTIASLLEGLKVWNMQVPGYNDMVITELHEDKSGFYVKVYLRNCTQSNPYSLKIPGCNIECPINQFIDIINQLVITSSEWKSICELKNPNYVPGKEPLP
uniref:acid phosphatase n=1 Tax=Trichogramma kaykai TaxID=54128 RepID=A0ABD2WK55_9HYME